MHSCQYIDGIAKAFNSQHQTAIRLDMARVGDGKLIGFLQGFSSN